MTLKLPAAADRLHGLPADWALLMVTNVVKKSAVIYEMFVLDKLTLLVAYAFGSQRAASQFSGELSNHSGLIAHRLFIWDDLLFAL
jgi:hypothetical protein